MSQDHFASLERQDADFQVLCGQTLIATAHHILLLRETYGEKQLPAVPYFPPDSLKQEFLVNSDHETYCPIKGDASYFGLNVENSVIENAIWYYPDPVADLRELAGYIAFYPQYVEITPPPGS